MSHSIAKLCVFGLTLLILSLFMANAAYAQATLTMTLEVSPTFDIDINGNLTYTAKVTNTSTLDAPNLTVTFTLTPDDLAISPPPSGGCNFTPSPSNLTAVCKIANLNPNQEQDFVIVVHPTNTAPRDVTAKAKEDGGGTASASVTSQIIEVGISDVAIALSADPVAAQVNTPLTYTMTVVNNGDDDAGNVFAVLALPPKASFVSASKGCTHSKVMPVCNIGHLGVGASKTVSVTILPAITGWNQATAGVRLSTPDPSMLNDAVASEVWVNP